MVGDLLMTLGFLKQCYLATESYGAVPVPSGRYVCNPNSDRYPPAPFGAVQDYVHLSIARCSALLVLHLRRNDLQAI